MTSDTQTSQPKQRKLKFRMGFFSVAVCAMGLLIWARLMLVTTPPPRSAIAQPQSQGATKFDPSSVEKFVPAKPPADGTTVGGVAENPAAAGGNPTKGPSALDPNLKNFQQSLESYMNHVPSYVSPQGN